jgi:proteic killer suppression protein
MQQKNVLKFANSERKIVTLHHIYKNMIVVFEKTYLKELYEDGTAKDKKHRFQPEVVRRYQRGIRYLISASRIEALYSIHSLHYEMLSGDKEGISSIRVNDKYRIEFIVSQTDEKPVVTVCRIIELSNHYK